MPRYASSTSVAVEKSRAEIETVLTKYGAEAFGYRTSQSAAMIEFAWQGRHVRFLLPLPDRSAREFQFTPAGRRRLSADKSVQAWEQACRSRWRALLLAVKAKLECVEIGISQFDQEFFAFLVDPITGHTIYEEVRPRLEARHEGREVPLLNPPEPDSVSGQA